MARQAGGASVKRGRQLTGALSLFKSSSREGRTVARAGTHTHTHCTTPTKHVVLKATILSSRDHIHP